MVEVVAAVAAAAVAVEVVFFCVRCDDCVDQILSPIRATFLDVRN